MQINLSPEMETKLNELAGLTGRSVGDLLQGVISGYFEDLERTRSMLDRRYDDYKSGKVQPIDGEEAFARLREKSARIRSERT